jgi:hypothetical protein
MGVGTIIGLVTAVAGLGGAWLKWRSIRQQRQNAPDMIANANAKSDQAVVDRTTTDLSKGDLNAVEKDLS